MVSIFYAYFWNPQKFNMKQKKKRKFMKEYTKKYSNIGSRFPRTVGI